MRILRKYILGAVVSVAAAVSATEAPKIYYTPPHTEPEIKETGYFSALEDPGADNLELTPPGADAAAAAAQGIYFEWIPSADTSSLTGDADLTGAAISADQTLLAVLERIGGAGEPNSGRVLFFNLNNGKLINGITLEKVRPGDAAFIPGTPVLVVAEHAQPELGRHERILTVNPSWNGNMPETVCGYPADGEISSLAAGKNFAACAIKGEKYFQTIRPGESGKAVTKVRTLIETPALIADGENLLAAGKGRAEYFNMAAAEPELLYSFALPEDFTADGGFGNGSGEYILFDTEGRKAMLVRNKTFRMLNGDFTGTGCVGKAGKIVLGVEYKKSLSVFNPPKSEAVQTVSPGAIKPFSKADVLAVFYRTVSDELILVDRKAVISRIKINPRRWNKTVIFAPPEHQY